MNIKTIFLREEKKYLRYWPVVALYGIVIAFSLFTISLSEESHYMSHFMGWTLIAFGLLKLEDINSFAVGFQNYDLFAKKSLLYAKLYPALEVVMGVLYLLSLFTLPITIAVLVMYSSTMLGLFYRLHKGEMINCLCLGVRFKLPLSVVAVFESVIMIIMALWMLSM